MMKKVASIIGLLAMLISLAGCVKTPADPDENLQTTTTADTTVSNVDGTTDTSAQTTSDTTTSRPTGSASSKLSTTTTSTTTKASEKFNMKYYPRYRRYITVRGGIKNTGYKIAEDKELTIAFMGGSVTDGMGSTKGTAGFRGRLLKNLPLVYKNVTFNQVAANLGGNGSQYGVYITKQLVADKKPDLVFIEYAVNNAYDGVTDAQTLWAHYETMIHIIRTANPYADIVLLYVSDDSNVSRFTIPELEKIAKKYDLVSVNLYEAINEAMESNGFGWSKYYIDNVHMTDAGYDIAAEVLQGVIETSLSTLPATYQKMSTAAPQSTIQREAKAVFTSELATVPSGWAKSTDFGAAKYGGCIKTTEAGKAITVKFKGTDFGVLVEYAANAGVLEYSVDGGAYQTLDCNLSYSNPKARLLLKNGTSGEHTITMRLATAGKHMAIAAFLLNGTVLSIQ